MIPGFFPIVGSTEAEAYARRAELDAFLDLESEVERIATLLESAGIGVWDGTDPELRRTAREPGELPIVPYDSLRGLEGWATFLLELDERDRQRLKYPNLAPGETVSEDDVARRSLLLALTRAAHVLVVTVKDPGSRTAGWLEEAAREVGPDIVERWT